MKYEFDLEKFKKFNKKLCPCLVLSRDVAIIENMCPCDEFVKEGICRCNLFKVIKKLKII